MFEEPENKGHSTAKCLHFPKDYEFIPPEKILPTMPTNVPLRTFVNDVVAIVLNDKLAVDPVPLAEGVAAEPGLRLVHAAYPADRRFALTAHFNCHLLRSDPEKPLWLNDCDTHPASSGGPLFTRIDGTLKLVAILLATGERLYNLALPISRMEGPDTRHKLPRQLMKYLTSVRTRGRPSSKPMQIECRSNSMAGKVLIAWVTMSLA